MSTHVKTGRSKRKLFIFAIAAVLLATLAWYAHHYLSLEELADQERRIRDYIALKPWLSFAVGFGVYSVLALVPGTGGKAIIYGWLFGFWRAVVIVTIGLTLAAMATFSLSRYLFRESIEHRYTVFLSLMNRHIEKEGAFYLFTLRMAHAPYSIVNPVSGASRVRTWTFFWTTAVGLLPANAVWVYVGMRLPSLHELAKSGPNAFLDLPLIGVLAACATLPLVIRWLLGRFGISAAKTTTRVANTHDPEGESP